MTITRIPVATGIDAELAGSGIISKGSIAKNVLYSQYVDKRIYATQRPAINIKGISSLFSLPPMGRGIAYWDAAEAYIIVVNDTVYLGGYGGPMAQKIAPGRDPVQILELQDYLIILDSQGNQGWYIEATSPTTLLEIVDSDFPGNLPNVEIAGGGAVLDGYLFVMDTKGTIYNSDLNDPTSWDALNFIASQREEDAGVFLTKHHDHLVAIGTKSIEFFYDAGNAVGSPIQPRQDISYVTGAIDIKSVFNTGDIIYFVGSEKVGTTAVFKIEQFTLKKVSVDSIDTFLSVTRARSKYDFGVAGATVGDHHLIFITSLAPETVTLTENSINVNLIGQSITSSIGIPEAQGGQQSFPIGQVISTSPGIITVGGDVTADASISITGQQIISGLGAPKVFGTYDIWLPQYTLVYDSLTDTFVEFDTTISNISAFSVVAATERSAVSERESIILFYNGDYGNFDMTFNKLDGASSDPDYVEADYIVNQDDYIQDLGQDTVASIEAIILLGESDFGSVTNKFINRISYVGTTTANAENITPLKISWTDDHYRTFSPERDLATGLNRSLTRLGTMRRRAFQLRYTGTDVIRVEGLELDLRASQYA